MKVGIICAPGGHLVQALEVLEAFEGHEVFLITYRSGVLEDFDRPPIRRVYPLKFFGATNFRIILSLLWSVPVLFGIFRKERPGILFSTGSEIAIPAFYMAKWLFGTRLIFLETVVRSHTPTLTARALYPVSDLLLAQWENMAKEIGPRAVYAGSVL